MQIFRLKTLLASAILALSGAQVSAQNQAPNQAQNQEVIGYIKTVDANANVVLGGQATPAKPGMALQRGMLLKTGTPGGMGVIFKDSTTLSIGPDTELWVDEYLFTPGKGELKLGASLAKGSLYYISGVIAKLKPESVTVKTPTGMIGVRGTQFLAKVDPKDTE